MAHDFWSQSVDSIQVRHYSSFDTARPQLSCFDLSRGDIVERDSRAFVAASMRPRPGRDRVRYASPSDPPVFVKCLCAALLGMSLRRCTPDGNRILIVRAIAGSSPGENTCYLASAPRLNALESILCSRNPGAGARRLTHRSMPPVTVIHARRFRKNGGLGQRAGTVHNEEALR